MPDLLIPPQALDAEQAALGSMLLDSAALHTGLELLRSADFYRPAHSAVFDALSVLASRNEPVDILSVKDALSKLEQLEEVGGAEYIMALVNTVPTAANIEHYAKIVAEKSVRRQVIALCQSVMGTAYNDENADAAEVLMSEALKLGGDRSGRIRPIREIVGEVWQRMESYQAGKPKRGIPFGIPTLDRLTYGVCPGDFVLIGGRPSEGKTVLLTQLCFNAGIRQYPTLLFSKEMSAEDVVERMAYMVAKVRGDVVRCGYITPENWEKLAEAHGKLWDASIDVEDSEGPLTDLCAKARRWCLAHAKAEQRLILIDYLQLIRYDGRYENETTKIANITAALKSLARGTGSAVVVAAQLNREARKGARDENSRPAMEHLKGSGSQEAEADKIIVIDNNPRNGVDFERKRECKLYVDKHRNGSTGEMDCWFYPDHTLFAERTDRDDAPADAGKEHCFYWDE